MPYDESLSLAVCPACSTPVHRVRVGGLEYTANLTGLTAIEAVGETLAGRRLYRITFVGSKAATMRPAGHDVLRALATAAPEERPHVVAEHPCTAVSRPITPSGGPGPAEGPKGPQTGVQSSGTPSSAPSTEHSGARDAGPTRSEARLPARPRCSACGEACEDGTYASVALGELVLWAQHVTLCTA